QSFVTRNADTISRSSVAYSCSVGMPHRSPPFGFSQILIRLKELQLLIRTLTFHHCHRNLSETPELSLLESDYRHKRFSNSDLRKRPVGLKRFGTVLAASTPPIKSELDRNVRKRTSIEATLESISYVGVSCHHSHGAEP